MNYNAVETETIGLCIALEAVSDLANHGLLDLRDIDSLPGEAEVRFSSRAHQQLFLIRLVDFAKERGDQTLTGISGSCLEVLLAACESKSFDRDESINCLRRPVHALNDWLRSKTSLRLWLPTLNLEANLVVPRIEFLYIAGNQAKHNLSRLTAISKRIVKILKEHGHDVLPGHVPLALEDFREHLQEDYFVYYGTWLAELLNNVRWGLQEYLVPTFKDSYYKIHNEELRYEYRFPDSITNPIAREWFWRLMNHVRARPYLKKFCGAHYMKREILH